MGYNICNNFAKLVLLTFKTFIKSFLFIIILGITIYFVIDKIQYKNNIMGFEDYSPVSTLKVKQTKIRKAKYPFIDVHSHQFDMPIKDLNNLISDMDSLNMAFMINLSGFRGYYLRKSIENINKTAPNRFGVFVNINFEEIDSKDFIKKNIKLLNDAKAIGAIGLKVYKSLGLTDMDNKNHRIAVNDSRLDSIWSECGKIGFPVLIHSGEPSSFWHPKDKFNERWLELKQKPNRYLDPKEYISYDSILSEQHEMFRNNPNTKFINAHLGWMGNDLDRLESHLNELPNVVTEIGAVLAELGRQPKRAKEFFIKYQDRILFGKDAYNVSEYYTYFRVLESDDEYFNYYRKRHAHWKMYGLALNDSILKKVYYKNALRLFPSIKRELFIKN